MFDSYKDLFFCVVDIVATKVFHGSCFVLGGTMCNFWT